MSKYFVRLALPLLLSGVLFLTIAAIQQPKRTLLGQSLPAQQANLSQISLLPANPAVAPAIAAEAVDDFTQPLAVEAEWHDTCANQRMEITGIGMGDNTTPINPQSLSLTNPAGVNWLLAQVAGRYNNAPTPDSVTLTTSAPQSLTLNQPSRNTSEGYTFETNLQPANQITAFVNNPGDGYKTPRGLILYAKRGTGSEQWTSIGKTINEFVHWESSGNESHTEPITFQPLTQTTDLIVTAVVIDNNADERPLKLEATANNVTEGVTENGPTDGHRLNIIHLTLPQVPTGTDQVSITLESPQGIGDSLVWVGVNVSFRCGDNQGVDLALTKMVNFTPSSSVIHITYTVTLTNNGPNDATGIKVIDMLPSDVTYISHTANPGNYDSNSGLWTVDDLLNSANAILTIKAQANGCTNSHGITNVAKILSVDQTDPTSNNNEARASIFCVYLPMIFKDSEPPICIPYFDNFSNSTSGWETGNYVETRLDYTVRIGDIINVEKYFIKKKVSGLRIVQAPIISTNKFSTTVEVYADSGMVGEYGITFGQIGHNVTSPAYSFSVNPITQKYRLEYGNSATGWKCINKPAPCEDNPPPSTVINSGATLNHLGVECDGTNVTLYINYQQVWQGNLPKIWNTMYGVLSAPKCYGQLGLIANTYNNSQTKAYFDNFQLSCPYSKGQVY
jgi:uncharacterized repeat protein (TIGR01451 family)